MAAYVEQLSVSARPSTTVTTDGSLRLFAGRITAADLTCVAVASIGRTHIEDYKVWLAARPGRNKTVSPRTIAHQLGILRTFFERIIEWDYDDAPARVPIYNGDIPTVDEPLPRALDDPTAARFMAALATDPNPRRRLMVELLARTGIRVSELAALGDDTVADQYFRVTEAVEAGYHHTTARPHAGAEERQRAAEAHRRLLGNGHCGRPVGLDCNFESICERCGFFDTGPEFIPILRRQRDHAHERGQHDRAGLFDNVITTIADRDSDGSFT